MISTNDKYDLDLNFISWWKLSSDQIKYLNHNIKKCIN